MLKSFIHFQHSSNLTPNSTPKTTSSLLAAKSSASCQYRAKNVCFTMSLVCLRWATTQHPARSVYTGAQNCHNSTERRRRPDFHAGNVDSSWLWHWADYTHVLFYWTWSRSAKFGELSVPTVRQHSLVGLFVLTPATNLWHSCSTCCYIHSFLLSANIILHRVRKKECAMQCTRVIP